MSNYEWQNQQTKQRIGAAMREAEQHRAAKLASGEPERSGWLSRLLTRIGRRRQPESPEQASTRVRGRAAAN